MVQRPLALTLDLDDTLWPVLPALERADRAVDAWLQQHHPEVARAWPITAMRQLRAKVAAERIDLAHDFTTQRQLTLRHVFEASGIADAPVDALWEIYFAARNQVELFPDCPSALERIAARWPLASLTNGNADLRRIGLATHFRFQLGAGQHGAAKPDASIFHAACTQLGVEPQHVLHVGDDVEQDIVGAHRAGLRTCWINRADHAGLTRRWPHDAVRPDLAFTTLAALADWLDAAHDQGTIAA